MQTEYDDNNLDYWKIAIGNYKVKLKKALAKIVLMM